MVITSTVQVRRGPAIVTRYGATPKMEMINLWLSNKVKSKYVQKMSIIHYPTKKTLWLLLQ